ncbi:hypothetical protein E2C01_050015 [Portunus trituberculatus]|uniref:Uncharacterized protein n=1 Tax=Portunus trituberculatus TaxID=210409 RepID=A0A5B7GFC3_PORTR|nr:hypothetical protein [Portunus trituberculatus]
MKRKSRRNVCPDNPRLLLCSLQCCVEWPRRGDGLVAGSTSIFHLVFRGTWEAFLVLYLEGDIC